MNENQEISPAEGWGYSLPRVLLWPLAIYFIFGVVDWFLGGASFFFAAFGAFLGMVIHFIAYIFFGLSFYICFWRTSPELWTWKIGLPIGTALGALSLLTVLSLMNGFPSSMSDLTAPSVLGGAYGLITAAAAITSRRKNKK